MKSESVWAVVEQWTGINLYRSLSNIFKNIARIL